MTSCGGVTGTSQACSWCLRLAPRRGQPVFLGVSAGWHQNTGLSPGGGCVWVGRRVSVHVWEAPLPAASLACTRSWPSLITGLDSSNSVLQGFDLMWGWLLQSTLPGGGAEGRGQEGAVLAEGVGAQVLPTPG